MAAFLGASAVVLFICGWLLLFSPKSMQKISKLANRGVLNVDSKMRTLRRPLGIIFLLSAIIFWCIVLAK